MPKVGFARTGIALVALALVAAVLPSSAGAASVAYVDQGEVWLSSLDGTQKVRLAAPVVNGSGDTENWLDVAQSDGGRIVAVRNKPGRMSSFSWFKIWEPDGSSTVEGPLNAPSGWTTYAYPLGFDITADGKHLVYGYSNGGSCCPITFGFGTYVRNAVAASPDPKVTPNKTRPTLVGSRMVAVEQASSPSVVQVQNPSTANPYADDFTPWLDTSGTGYDLNAVDLSADGRLLAIGLETWDGGTQTVGRIGVIATQGLDQPPAFPAAVDCYVPTTGVAKDPSLAPDGATLAWSDGGGVKVAGTPTTIDDPCVMRGATVTLSPTGAFPSIGGANVATFLPAGPPAGPGDPGGPGGPGPSDPAAPVASVPATLKAKALAAAKGVGVKVTVAGAGEVAIKGTVPAKRLGRSGKPVVVARGKAPAAGAGTVTVRLRLTSGARKRLRRLKGAKLTLKITQGGRTTTEVVRLR